MANPSPHDRGPHSDSRRRSPQGEGGSDLDGFGLRLRTLRERRGATLAAVSAATGISVSTLSRLESGGRKATLELLIPLAREYGVTLDELVTLPTVRDPRITPQPHREGDRIVQTLSRRASQIQVFRTRIEARPDGAAAPERLLMTHPGFDWVYVLAGRLLLVLGEREFVLERGQAAEFDTSTPHWFGAADARPVDYLSLFTHAAGRAHRHQH